MKLLTIPTVPLQLFYDLDTELTYTCLTGFKRKGFQEAQCFFYNDSARWFGPDLECHPIDCGPPQDILNGKRLGDCTTYRCQVCVQAVQGSAKRLWPGCMNAAGKLRQKW